MVKEGGEIAEERDVVVEGGMVRDKMNVIVDIIALSGGMSVGGLNFHKCKLI